MTTNNYQERILHWEGCNNLRDLGGLRAADGRTTRFGALIRGDTPKRLTPAGWQALHAHGVRTIIRLLTDGMDETEWDFTPPYADITLVQAPIEDFSDREFLEKWVVTELWGTPLYFADAFRRWPGQHAAVVSAVARAQPGGVLFHCIRGYDRTGIIAFLLLALAGVTPDEITDDYELSLDPTRDELLARYNTSTRQAIRDTLTGWDVEGYLRAGGVSPEEIAAVRQRMLG